MQRFFFLALLAGWLPASAAVAEVELTVHPGPQPTVIDDPAREQTAIQAVPGSASFVNDSQWNDSRGDTIKDVTDYLPGVIAQPHDGAESARLSVRGSGLANSYQGRGLLVLEDGVPINMADGEFEFPVIDPWLIRYAEVFPGANALEYGASDFGGAINFITPRGETNGAELRAEAGSFGTLHGQASASGKWADGDLFASLGDFYQDGYREQNRQDTARVSGNWGWQPDANFTNRVYFNHTHADAEIPGALSLAEIADDPRQANPLNAKNDYQRNLDITRLADRSAWSNGPDRIETTVFYAYRTLDNPVTTYEFQHNNDTGVRAKYTHQDGLNQWIFGFNDYYGMAAESRFRNLDARPGVRILDRDLYAFTSEAYAQYQQHVVGRLYAIADLQGSYALRDITQSFPTTGRQDESYTGFNPRVGLRYDLDFEKQLFANLSRSFEPPTWSELSGGNVPGFTDLKAQKATTAEIGTRLGFGPLNVQASYYHGWLNNEFVDYRFADGDTATINAPRTRRDGVELGMNGDVAHALFVERDALVARAAYTFSHFTLDDDRLYGNNTLPGVPEHYLRAELLYRHPFGIAFGPNVEWSPRGYPIDLTNSLYTDSYAIYGLRTFWDSPNGRLHFYVEGRNLFNKDYIATSNVVPDAGGQDGRYFYPGEGRAIYAGMRWSL